MRSAFARPRPSRRCGRGLSTGHPCRPARLRLVASGVETIFGWTAGAAATLLGLLFVAVQVGFGRVSYDTGNRLHATARPKFTVFVVSLLFLYPGLDRRGLSIGIAIMAGFGAYSVTRCWLPVWGGMLREHRLERTWQTAWLLLAPLVCLAFLVYDSYDQFMSPQRRILEVAVPAVILGLLGVAIRNAWNLLVQQAGRVEAPTANRD